MSKASHSTGVSWMPSFVRRESELTLSFALTLQIQRIMQRSLCRRRFSVSAFMAQVSAACSITLLTHDEYTLPLVRRGTRRLVRRGSNCRNLPHAHDTEILLNHKSVNTGEKPFSCEICGIMPTCPYNVYPLTPHFYIVKLGFTGVFIFFLFLL